METRNKVILLVNTGTPDRPERNDVRKYLSQFLNDPRVIDMPYLLRKILVNLIIIPFRTSKSTRLYKQLWTKDGSPLLLNLKSLTGKLRTRLGDEYSVMMAMRYGNPALIDALRMIKNSRPDELIIFPLYPHYASSTTGSVHQDVMNEIKRWNEIPEIKFAGPFFSHPSFIEVFTNQISKYHPEKFDHILFSYHSLPLSHIRAVHPSQDISACGCMESMPDSGRFCYKAACYMTTRLLAHKLNLVPGNYSTSFQSRFSRNWLGPFTDEVLKDLVHTGKKKVLSIAPSFVADCLETKVEFDNYRVAFNKQGGEELTLVESLNDNDDWVEAVIEIAGIGQPPEK